MPSLPHTPRLSLPASLLSALFIITTASLGHAQAVGYGRHATGGAGGKTVKATTVAEYTKYVTSPGPLVIQISGTINGIGNRTDVTSNKTIVGIGRNPTIVGDIRLYPANNIIIKNLYITSSNAAASKGGEDGVTIKNGAHDIWIDHCTFTDCADGSVDVTLRSDNVPISWCKFQYTHDHGHDFVNLIGASDTDPDAGTLHVTLHHNWYANGCKERMPRVRFGQVHVFNNYFSAAANHYDIGVGKDAQILLENNYFENQNAAWKNYGNGKIHWNSGNVFVNTAIPTWAANSSVFNPPYSYSVNSGSSVKGEVISGAGAH